MEIDLAVTHGFNDYTVHTKVTLQTDFKTGLEHFCKNKKYSFFNMQKDGRTKKLKNCIVLFTDF